MGGPIYGRADYLKLGTWNAVCSMCGRKRKADEMVRNWQGLYRCPEHNEARQPQDFARGVPEHMEVPWAQVPQKRFLTECAFNDTSSIAGYAVAGCWVVGNFVFIPNL